MNPWMELDLQRINFGLEPLEPVDYLMKCAQAKAEYIAAHHVSLYNGYEGHEGPTMGPGFVEGCGHAEARWGWVSCAMRTIGRHCAGTGLCIGSDGKRFMCLIIMGTDLEETSIQKPTIDTSYLSPNPPVIAYKGRIPRGYYEPGKLPEYIKM